MLSLTKCIWVSNVTPRNYLHNSLYITYVINIDNIEDIYKNLSISLSLPLHRSIDKIFFNIITIKTHRKTKYPLIFLQ